MSEPAPSAETPEQDGAEAPTPEPEETPPADPRLLEAQRAFDVGDFRRVRTIADDLARSEAPEIARAAVDLRRRVTIDPVQIGVLVACLIFFAVIVAIYVL